jgi:4-hydroxybenzoyl-CoA thioesterase
VIVYERPVRFEDVDAARIVFFGRYLFYAHEAMEHFFSGLEGGYPRLIVERGVGLPAVDVKCEFYAPVRYGDKLRIETSTAKLGNKSAQLRYRMLLERSGEPAATVLHTIVTTDLAAMKSIAMPSDVRAIFEAHLE